MGADFTGLKGALLYEHYIRQEGDSVTRTVTANEVAGWPWLHEVALRLGKHKLAGEANTYAKRLVEGGFGTAEGIAGLDVGDLTEAGMRKGDAKTLMRNVSKKCYSSVRLQVLTTAPPTLQASRLQLGLGTRRRQRRVWRWWSRTPLRRHDQGHRLLCTQSRPLSRCLS